jgi:hypothetical protein
MLHVFPLDHDVEGPWKGTSPMEAVLRKWAAYVIMPEEMLLTVATRCTILHHCKEKYSVGYLVYVVNYRISLCLTNFFLSSL